MEDNKLCLEKQPLNQEMLDKIDAYWRAANYLSAGQLYLLDNPLLREPLTMDQIKKKIVGHWGTVPGQNFVYAHCNRVIKRYDLDMILLSGPGHGGNFMIANTYLEGSYSEVYPNISQDEEGMKKMFKQFSFPCGVPSHCASEPSDSACFFRDSAELPSSFCRSSVSAFFSSVSFFDFCPDVFSSNDSASTSAFASCNPSIRNCASLLLHPVSPVRNKVPHNISVTV